MKWVALFAMLGCSHSDPWAEYRSEPGRYRAEFPGKTELKSQQTPSLPPTTSYQAVVDRGARGDFQVSYYELAVVTPDLAKSAIKLDCGMANERGWTAVATSEPKLGDVTGFQTDAVIPVGAGFPEGGFEQDRCFVIGSRMYHLTTVGPDTADQRRDSARFLDSFKPL